MIKWRYMNLKIEEFVKDHNLESEPFCNVWKKYEDFLRDEEQLKYETEYKRFLTDVKYIWKTSEKQIFKHPNWKSFIKTYTKVKDFLVESPSYCSKFIEYIKIKSPDFSEDYELLTNINYQHLSFLAYLLNEEYIPVYRNSKLEEIVERDLFLDKVYDMFDDFETSKKIRSFLIRASQEDLNA